MQARNERVNAGTAPRTAIGSASKTCSVVRLKLSRLQAREIAQFPKSVARRRRRTPRQDHRYLHVHDMHEINRLSSERILRDRGRF